MQNFLQAFQEWMANTAVHTRKKIYQFFKYPFQTVEVTIQLKAFIFRADELNEIYRIDLKDEDATYIEIDHEVYIVLAGLVDEAREVERTDSFSSLRKDKLRPRFLFTLSKGASELWQWVLVGRYWFVFFFFPDYLLGPLFPKRDIKDIRVRLKSFVQALVWELQSVEIVTRQTGIGVKLIQSVVFGVQLRRKIRIHKDILWGLLYLFCLIISVTYVFLYW